MNYTLLKKDELIKIIQTQVHLASTVETKDKEITALNETNIELERKITEIKDAVTVELKKKHEDATKVLTDSLANGQTRYEELEKVRIQQLNEVLYAYGDIIKAAQAMTDTHMKLNSLIVKELSGGEPNGT